MHEENYRMIDQVQQVYEAVQAHRESFISSREAIEADKDFKKKEVALKSLENPYIECVLLFEKDEEIHPETIKYVMGLGLDLKECSKEEKTYRAIPAGVDAYKLVGRLAY